jgi:hypothetical protein
MANVRIEDSAKILHTCHNEGADVTEFAAQGIWTCFEELTVIERIQELVLTWSVNVRPGLAAIGVPNEVLNRADKLTSKLAQMTSGAVNRGKVFAALGGVWKVLHAQILLEIAKIPPGVLAATTATAPVALFPEISDLPNQLVPFCAARMVRTNQEIPAKESVRQERLHHGFL